MSLKDKSRRFTLMVSLFIVLLSLFYFSYLFGSLAHELVHANNAMNWELIRIRADGSADISGSFFPHDHAIVYLKGDFFTVMMMLIYTICVLVIAFARK